MTAQPCAASAAISKVASRARFIFKPILCGARCAAQITQNANKKGTKKK